MSRATSWTVVTLVSTLAGSLARAQTTEIASSTASGGPSNGDSFYSSVSADGRFVAFESFATNLVASDTNGTADVFVRDRANGTTVRVSVATSGAHGNGASRFPSISADGRFVAFHSDAANLVVGDTNGASDVFVHDLQTGATERVSIATGGGQANAGSAMPSISADGRFVAFDSNATDLVAGDTNGAADIFVRDRVSGTTERVSVTTSGAQVSGGSRNAAISADGSRVAFEGFATGFVAGDTNASVDVFVRNRLNGTTVRASVTSGGAQANSASLAPCISADGRFVAFFSGATNLVAGDTNDWSDVFVRDLQSGTTERASVSSSGAEGNFHAYECAISADGRFVAFWSFANNLAPGDTNFFGDVFLRDRESGTTEFVSVATNGSGSNSGSSDPAISADGRFVTFYSASTDLVPNDGNGTEDVFVRDRGTSAFTSICAGDGTVITCPCGNDGASGRGCGNSAFASGAGLAGSGVASVALDGVTLSATNLTGSVALFFQGNTATAPVVADDGLGCVSGGIVRLGTKAVVANASAYPGAGDPSISARASLPVAGGTFHYQCFYRNASPTFCTPATSNRTNGVSIHWGP